MNPIPENALPNYDESEIMDPSAFFRTIFHLRDIREERAIPAIVTDYDAKTGMVTALPMAKFTFDTRDGEAEVDRCKVKVRILKMCHGGFSISLPIFKGDTGWLIAGDRRCGKAIEKNSEILVSDLTDEELKDRTNKPDDFSLLNFDNGFFLPFSWELEDAEKNPNGNYVIRNVRDKIGGKELENEFGVVRDDEGNDVPSFMDANGKTHSIDGRYHGQYAWSMIELEKEGSVNLYGQGRKFTVRSEGLYLDDRPLKFLDDLVLTADVGIEITKVPREDGKVEFKFKNNGVIGLEQGDNVEITQVEGQVGVFRISATGSGVRGKLIDHTEIHLSTDPGGQNIIIFFYTDGTSDEYSIANGLNGAPGSPGRNGNTPEITADKVGDHTYIYADGELIATIIDGHSPQITAQRTGTKQTTIFSDGVAIAVINDGADGQGGGGGEPVEQEFISNIDFSVQQGKIVAYITKKVGKFIGVSEPEGDNPVQKTICEGTEVEVVTTSAYYPNTTGVNAVSFVNGRKKIHVISLTDGTPQTVFTATKLSDEH